MIPGVRVKEDQNSNTGYAMPEFPGYTGPASDQCWLIKVTAVTHREHPIMQTCIGPSEEHVSMAGIPTEASIYGMVILFIGLMTGLIRLDDVKDVGKFLIEIMPLMFIPAGVGLIESWGTLKPVLLPVCAITVVTIVTVMVATGKLSQWMIRREKKGGSDHE